MAKIMYVQTVLTVDDIEALKRKTGESSTKDALEKAVSLQRKIWMDAGQIRSFVAGDVHGRS